MSLSKQLVWLVTGCSTGIGREIILQILARGDKAIATARNVSSLQDLEKAGAATLQLDVTASSELLKEKVVEASKVYGQIDVFFANAGAVDLAPVEEMDIETNLLPQLNLHTLGTLAILQSLMSLWRAQKFGLLLVNSSYMSWWNEGPGGGSYNASKAALERLVNSFAGETAHLGYIKTLIVNPGHFRTEVSNPAKYVEFGKRKTEHYAELHEQMVAFMSNAYKNDPGDTRKLCKVLIDLVRGEGDVGGRELPPRLPLGSDAFEACVQRTEKFLKDLKEWEAVIRSTDIVPGSTQWGLPLSS